MDSPELQIAKKIAATLGISLESVLLTMQKATNSLRDERRRPARRARMQARIRKDV